MTIEVRIGTITGLRCVTENLSENCSRSLYAQLDYN